MRSWELRLSDHREVLAVEADVLIEGQARLAQVRPTSLLSGFYAVHHAIGDTLKVALARALAIAGSGSLVEITLPDSLTEPRLGLIRVQLNAGAIPAQYEQLEIVAAAVPGDFDGDGAVAFEDFFLFADHFGEGASVPGFDSRYDLDLDGLIGFEDFFLFADRFGD
ncbi:MAG: hypothetical protein WDA75_02570 [Candidatus Latescibacterota bacterium]